MHHHSSQLLTGSLLVVLSLVAVACGDDSGELSTPDDSSAVAQLQGKSYDLVGVTGIEVPEGSAVKMTFLATDLDHLRRLQHHDRRVEHRGQSPRHDGTGADPDGV